MVPLLILWCTTVAVTCAFLLARYAVASIAGIHGRAARFGFVTDAWGSVALLPRIVFAAAGPLAWYAVAVASFTLAYAILGDERYDATNLHVDPAPGGPAGASGVQKGDRVVSIDGDAVSDWDAIRAHVRARTGSDVPIVVERGGELITLRPAVGRDGRIGIQPMADRRPLGPGAALAKAIVAPFRVWAATLTALKPRSGPVEVSGPVGIVRETAKLSRRDAPAARGLETAGGLASYFFWVPVLVAIVLFPRRRSPP